MEKIPTSNNDYYRLENHKELLIDSANYLHNKNHCISFIGSVGVGKTTAICQLLDLLDGNKTLLKTGSGRTTLCEVEIRSSHQLSIIIEPFKKKEIENFLLDFSIFIEEKFSIKKHDNGSKPFKLSDEIERALRNMLNLKIKRRPEYIDPAQELYRTLGSKGKFFTHLIKRINLENRTLTVLEDNEHDNETWIKNNFFKINNGQHEKVSLPKKIIINIKRDLIEAKDIRLSVIDTKGIDQTTHRQDIDKQLRNSRTLSILCTKFNDAPDKVTELLLRHMKDSGLVDYISERVIILVLERYNEAEDLAELDEPDAEEGREIRREQIEKALQYALNIKNVEIIFFNAKDDNPSKLALSIREKLYALRKAHQNRLALIAEYIHEIEETAHLETLRRIKASISTWQTEESLVKCQFKKNFQAVITEIGAKQTYASTVRASVNRQGVWDNFNYYTILQNVYKKESVSTFEPAKESLKSIIDNMIHQSDFSYGKVLLQQVRDTLQKRIDCLYNKPGELVIHDYEEKLKKDLEFWNTLQDEWGKGEGYKNRIAEKTNDWFMQQPYQSFDVKNSAIINNMWDDLLEEVMRLIS